MDSLCIPSEVKKEHILPYLDLYSVYLVDRDSFLIELKRRVTESDTGRTIERVSLGQMLEETSPHLTLEQTSLGQVLEQNGSHLALEKTSSYLTLGQTSLGQMLEQVNLGQMLGQSGPHLTLEQTSLGQVLNRTTLNHRCEFEELIRSAIENGDLGLLSLISKLEYSEYKFRDGRNLYEIFLLLIDEGVGADNLEALTVIFLGTRHSQPLHEQNGVNDYLMYAQGSGIGSKFFEFLMLSDQCSSYPELTEIAFEDIMDYDLGKLDNLLDIMERSGNP